MNVPVTPAGQLTFADGISAAGRYVEMRAEMDVIVLISNCPQLNNPCNAYNPTPVRVMVWDAPELEPSEHDRRRCGDSLLGQPPTPVCPGCGTTRGSSSTRPGRPGAALERIAECSTKC